MTIDLRTHRASALFLALAALLAPTLPAQATGETAAPEAHTAAPDREYERVLAGFAERRRLAWLAAMKTELAAIAKATGAPLEGDALQQAMRTAVDESVTEWMAKLREILRGNIGESAGDLEALEPNIQPGLEPEVELELVRDYTAPGEQPVWTGALRAALSTEQAAAFERWNAGRRQEALGGIQKVLRSKLDEARVSYEREIRFESTRLKTLLALAPESAQRLDASVAESDDLYLAAWRDRLARTLLSLRPEQYPAFENSLIGNNEPVDDLIAREHAAWRRRIPELLAPAEGARWAAWQSACRERWLRSYARALLAQVDPALALSSQQRAALEPLAQRLLASAVGRMEWGERTVSDVTGDAHWPLTDASRASDEEMQRTLDPEQRRRWRELCHPPRAEAAIEAAEARLLAQAGTLNEQPVENRGADEEAALEDARSEFTYLESRDIRRLLLEAFSVEIADARRAGDLPAEVVERLSTAARGAVEERLAEWKTGANTYIGDFLPNLAAPGELPSLHTLHLFLRGSGTAVPERTRERWAAKIAAEMTGPQRAAWDAERAHRVAFRNEAAAGAILAELDRISLFSAEQWAALERRLQEIIGKYGDDFGSALLGNTGAPWYLEGANNFLPVLAVPRKDLQAIVTPEQLEHWSAEPDYASAELSSQQLQALHDSRGTKP